MKIASDPTRPGRGARDSCLRARQRQGREFARSLRIERDGDAIVEPVPPDLVWPDQEVPGAGSDRPGLVRRGRPFLVDRDRYPLAAAPAPETRPTGCDASLIEQPDIERIPPADQRRRADPVVVVDLDLNLPQPGWELKRHMPIAKLLARLESPCQYQLGPHELTSNASQ